MPTDSVPAFGLVIIGDEIMSGKRADKHLPAVIERLQARGLQLAYADYVGDDPQRITATLQRAFASGDVVFSCGGIGATPDDHTRPCAARALGVALELHPQARDLIRERMQDTAREQGVAFEPERADNLHRLNMGVFPAGAHIIPNPYNKIPGFSAPSPGFARPPEGVQPFLGRPGERSEACTALPGGGWDAGAVHFVPGFPVMAWPMVEWVLDSYYAHWFGRSVRVEKSVIAFGSMEATLTPLMEDIERRFPGIKVFSLPSVDHPQYGRHIELGVKGEGASVDAAYAALLAGLQGFGVQLGPELVRS